MADLAISGTAAAQATSDAAASSPFAAVGVTSLASATPYVTAAVTLSTTVDGALSHLGIGALSADGSTYTVQGSPADVQAALRGLVFTPLAHQVPVGQSVTTGFTLTASDAAGTVTDAHTSVVATAADTLPTVTDTSATQAPTSTTTTGLPGDSGRTSFTPFAYTTITDPDAGASETTTITLAQNGGATDAVGLLSGTGLTKTGVGTYTLAAGTPGTETAALEAVRFAPADPGTAASLGVTLTVSDGAGVPVTLDSMMGLAGNPGGQTDVTNSAEALTSYNDTSASNATHTYATTVEAVLNGVTVVYDQSFDSPYSDPQVQAALGQAKAALQSAGATPGSPMQTASNLTTLSSQTSAAQTGSNTAPGVITMSETLGLPTYVGPNTNIPGAGNTEHDRGFFYILAGQTDINVNTVTATTVDRTVTTTSTDLLSQQYVVTGNSTAMPTTSTILVSSNNADVDGDFSSFTYSNYNIANSITSDGKSVLFFSFADNFEPYSQGNNNAVYLKNTVTGALTDVIGGANQSFDSAAVDGNGNIVVVETKATNLNGGATDGANEHLYIRNVSAGTTTLISPTDYVITDAATGATETGNNFVNIQQPSISGDGRYIVTSYGLAQNNQAVNDGLLLFDTATHTALDIAHSGVDRTVLGPNLSQDGSTVVLSTSLALQPADVAPADTDGHFDIYAYSVASNSFQLVSDAESPNNASVKGNGDSFLPVASNDGSRIAFISSSTNLDSRDTDTAYDIYVKDLNTGRLFLADVTADGSTKANAAATNPTISGDGTMVAFESKATNLVPGVTDGLDHIYVKTLATGAIVLLDQSSTGAPGNKGASDAVFSPNSMDITYTSTSSNLVAGPTNGFGDVFLSTVTAAATSPASTPPTITGVPATETDPGQAAIQPFSTAVVTGTETGQTYTVSLEADRTGTQQVGGTFFGGGFTAAGPDGATFSATSLSAVQAALRAVSFTPNSADTALIYNITSAAGNSPVGQVEILSTPAAPVTAPAITGVVSPETDPGGATLKPFATATVTDTNANPTITVQLQSVAVVNGQPQNLGTGGAFAGGGFTVAGGVATFTSTSLAAVQAAVQALNFTPVAADARIIYSISDGGSSASVASVDVLTTAAVPTNTPPTIGGAQAGQADAAGVAISPFSQVTVTDPDAGQSETVTVSFAAGNGALSGGGFALTGTAGGVSTYSVTALAGAAGASAAAAQADLRAAMFTPTAGQSATTTFTVSVSDGQAPAATDSTTSVVATYTTPVTPPPSGGGGGGTVTTTPLSVQSGLLTEFQNLERALPGGADALTLGTPVNAAFTAYRAVAAQLDNGQLSLAQAETALAHLVDGTTAVAVASYGFFTGSTPTAAGLDYLVHSPANATDLNDAYYARFSTENRYINFAANLATGPGAGAGAFQASYGTLSLADATAKAYAAVFGASADAAKVSALLDTLVPDGLGGQETRATYFAQYGGDGPNGQGTKAAMIGFLLANAVHDGSGVYGAATEHYLAALAHGTAPASGSELALTYGAPVNLVGFTPSPDPTVTG